MLILQEFTEKSDFWGGSSIGAICRGKLAKKGLLGQFTYLRGGLGEGLVFLRAVDTPMHNMIYLHAKNELHP